MTAARAALACVCIGRAITVSVLHGITEVKGRAREATGSADRLARGATALRGDTVAAAGSNGSTAEVAEAARIEVQGRARPVISHVRPSVDAGRYPAKGSLGEPVVVTAEVFTDGHDQVACTLLFRHEDEEEWRTAPMVCMDNDVWTAEFVPERLGAHLFCIRATVDWFGTWRHDLSAKAEAGQPVDVEFLVGSDIVAAAAMRAQGEDAVSLGEWANRLRHAAAAAAGGKTATGLELAACAAPGRSRGALARPSARGDLGHVPRSWSIARRHASALGTRCFPGRPLPTPRGPARWRTRPPACPTWRPWASTRSTCHRSTPSAPPIARAGTAARPRAGRPRESLGHRERGRRAHRHRPGPRLLRRLRPPGAHRRAPRHGHRAGPRVPVLTRPSLGVRTPGVVPPSP